MKLYMFLCIRNINCINTIILTILEADKLCGRLYQKLNSVLGQKIVMDHMPLLMVCLEVNIINMVILCSFNTIINYSCSIGTR